MDLKKKLRHVIDFPKKGIDFIDITTVLQDGEAFGESMDLMKEKLMHFGDYDLILGSESRGFIFASTLAYITGKGFIPVRKKGKLPYQTVQAEYQLEYGADVLELHEDAIKPGQKVVIVDDLLATGGTVNANIDLVKKLGGEVAGILFFIELTFLEGREKLKNYAVQSIIQF